MRVLYFVIGLLTASIYTANLGIAVCHSQMKQFEEDRLIEMLTVYNGGYEKGVENTRRKMIWTLQNLLVELETYKQREKQGN
jgi:hypothetical protein